MGGEPIAGVIGAIEEAVEEYCESCRRRVEPFVERQFSLGAVVARQRASLFADLLCYPLNALWAVPYLAARKAIESLDKVGWSVCTPLFERVPSGLKTRYQRETERLIYQELLQWPYDMDSRQDGTHAFAEALNARPSLQPLAQAIRTSPTADGVHREVRRLVDGYSSARALVSDLAGSVGTVVVGWMLFKDRTLGLLGIGERLARERARDTAVSQFVFGKSLGATWYRLFPPEPSASDVAMATVLIGAMITALCLVAGVGSDPLGKAVGLQKGKLHSLINDLEHRLRATLIRTLKETGQGPGAPARMDR
ncbi:MAG: DUF6635 family protein [Nitrospiraceae bacterium]